MNDEDLVKLEQNAFRDSMKDGLTETLAGFIFLMCAIMFNQPSFVGLFVVFYIIFLPRLVEASREKYTYPRIGYVKLRTKESDFEIKPFLLLLLIMIAASGIATQVLTNDILNIERRSYEVFANNASSALDKEYFYLCGPYIRAKAW